MNEMCQICGVIPFDVDRHAQFHKDLAVIAQSVVELGKWGDEIAKHMNTRFKSVSDILVALNSWQQGVNQMLAMLGDK